MAGRPRKRLRAPTSRWRRFTPLGVVVLLAAPLAAVGGVHASWTASETNGASSFNANGTFPNTYHTQAAANAPWIYHQMDDASGNTATDSSGSSRSGTYSTNTGYAGFQTTATLIGNVGNGTADLGEVFSSNDTTTTNNCGWAAANNTNAATNTYTIEFWFKTTSQNGGMLVDDGLHQYTTNSWANLDRYVYIDSANKLRFGAIVSGVAHEIVSNAAVNDNTWHLADAVQAASAGTGITAGLSLYIDGTKQTSTDASTTSSAGSKYWRVGCDTLSGAATTPASYGFDGGIDDVAIWNTTALTSTQVSNHWAARSGGTYATSITGDSPSLYWRLDDANPWGMISDASGNGDTGRYYGFGGATTFASSSGNTGDSDTALTFSGNTAAQNTQCAYATTTNGQNPGTTYSIEFWMKTTVSGTGGMLVDAGDSKYDQSVDTDVDRFVYLNTANQIEFGVASSPLSNIVSGTVNNGAWHLIDAVESTTTLKLYVDGTNVSTATGVTVPTTSGIQWHIGCDNAANMDQAPTVYGFNGSIDDVAIWQGTALSSAQITAHKNAVGANYATTIKADSPTIYYRMDDTTPGTITDQSGNGKNGAYEGFISLGTVTYSVAGALLNAQTSKAITLSSVAGTNPSQDLNPATFTIEVWIKTTTTTGGVIVGFGNNQIMPTAFDRFVWMDDTGKIDFGVFNGSTQVITSTSAYNDGNWHMVDASIGAAGMKLYVDGASVATNAAVTTPQNYNGYWRWGYDVLNSFTPAPDTLFFNGSIDELSIMHSQLADATVTSDYNSNY